jgi:hypothetical protein
MEHTLLQASQNGRTILSVDIADVDGGAATLYLMNGGPQPQSPEVGDFAYDFSRHTFSIRTEAGWRTMGKDQIFDRVEHPSGRLGSCLDFTRGGLPFWRPTGEERNDTRGMFSSIQSLLSNFRATFDARKIKTQNIKRLQSGSFLQLAAWGGTH